MTPPIDEFWPRPGQPTDTHPTEPIVPPVDPPPSGLPSDPPPGAVAVADTDWESRYEAEHKRTRIFMATTAAAGAALLGSMFFAVAQANSTQPTQFGGGDRAGLQAPGQPGGVPGQGLGQGQGQQGAPGFGHHDDFDDFDDD